MENSLSNICAQISDYLSWNLKNILNPIKEVITNDSSYAVKNAVGFSGNIKESIELFNMTMQNWIMIWLAILLLLTLLLSLSNTRKIVDYFSKRYLFWLSFCVWLIGVVVYSIGYYNPMLASHSTAVVPRAIISSFKMFVVAHDLARVAAPLQKSYAYMAIFSLTHFAAAFISFLFVFRLIGFKIASKVALWWLYLKLRLIKKQIHIFWGVNSASLTLAKDIEKVRNEPMIFIDIDDDKDESPQKSVGLSRILNIFSLSNSELAHLENLSRTYIEHCYGGPATKNIEDGEDIFNALNLKTIGRAVKRSNKCNMYFFSDDEDLNLSGALNVLKDKRLRGKSVDGNDGKIKIYMHARKSAGNDVIGHYSQFCKNKLNVDIQIVDSSYLSVALLKYSENYIDQLPVNNVEFEEEYNGIVTSSIKSMIIGFGETGIEAFKFLYEFSAFIGTNGKKTPFLCCAIDEKMDKLEGITRHKMRDIGEDELSFIKASVDSEIFWNKIKDNINDLNYLFITLDNDEVGLNLAVNIFKYALVHRDKGLKPLHIMTRIYDEDNKYRMKKIEKQLNDSINNNKDKCAKVVLTMFGAPSDIFNCKMIVDDQILKEAQEFHKMYENKKDNPKAIWKASFGRDKLDSKVADGELKYQVIYDINRKIEQNISNALHSRTKLIMMGLYGKNTEARLEEYNKYTESRDPFTVKYKNCGDKESKLFENMAKVEHERWVASHKLMGYKWGKEDDHVRKLHHDMCDWDKLDEETQSYDCNVVDTTIKIAFEKMKNGTNITLNSLS